MVASITSKWDVSVCAGRVLVEVQAAGEVGAWTSAPRAGWDAGQLS